MALLPGKIGIALGSGAARGFAHVGVLRGLAAAGIEPDVICGASAGAIIGAVHAAGRLDDFEDWARKLDRRQVLSLLDVSLSGGALRGRRLIEQVGRLLPEGDVGALPRPFAAVATDLESGREVWLQRGPLLDVLHASSAIPGVVSPVRIDDRWLVDGGIVNPVPVALCRALGAESVIAVDLNAALLTRRFRGEADLAASSDGAPDETDRSPWAFQWMWRELRRRFVGQNPGSTGQNPEPAPPGPPQPPSPGLYDVLNNTLEIMQVRITRSRMAGDPPELLVTPRLPDFAILDFHRAGEAIDEGRRAAERALATVAEQEAGD